jgi:hypothetical protein
MRRSIPFRRNRRIARETSVLANGLLRDTSTNTSGPLSALEEAVMIMATRLTGAVMHDGPLKIEGGGD